MKGPVGEVFLCETTKAFFSVRKQRVYVLLALILFLSGIFFLPRIFFASVKLQRGIASCSC